MGCEPAAARELFHPWANRPTVAVHQAVALLPDMALRNEALAFDRTLAFSNGDQPNSQPIGPNACRDQRQKEKLSRCSMMKPSRRANLLRITLCTFRE